ncbi:hypothetical protein Cal7507_2220 [Calothrix sp. PCC 7507]|nr:hypothetical protein Cal7507_2220 [Calothrix sp. PCC 7507]
MQQKAFIIICYLLVMCHGFSSKAAVLSSEVEVPSPHSHCIFKHEENNLALQLAIL